MQSILEKEEVHMKDLNKLYHAALYDIGGPELDGAGISSNKLATKSMKTYGDSIKIEHGNAKRGNIIPSVSKHPSGMLRKEVAEEVKAHSKIRDAAFMLRRAIMEAPRKKLPDNLQLKDILDGEVGVPNLVHRFFTYLITGTDKRRGNVSAKKRHIEALCADTIYSTTAGNKKPAKHLKLELAYQISAVESSDSLVVSDAINAETGDIDLTIHSESIPDVGILDRETTTYSIDSSKTIHRKRRRQYKPKTIRQ